MATQSDSFVSAGRLHIPGRPFDRTQIDAILEHVEAHPDTLDTLKVENANISEYDFQDLLAALAASQKSLVRVVVNRFNFLKSSAYFEHFRVFLLALPALQELDLSSSSLNSVHYGLLCNVLRKTPSPLVLNLSGCHFTSYDQETLFKVLPRLAKIRDLIIDNTNFSKNTVQALLQALKQPSSPFPIQRSLLVSDLAKSAVDGARKKPSKFAIDFSTVAKDRALPKILVRCGCTRAFPPAEMFICTSCSRSVCTYCAKSCVAITKCFNCSRAVSYAPENKQKTAKECKSCIECPVCKNSLTFVDSNSKYFACKFCLWSSIAFQGTEDRNEELASGMIKHTFLLGKEHETYLTELFYNYKDMMNDRVKSNLKDLWDQHTKMSELDGTQLRLEARRESAARREQSYRTKAEENFRHANLLKDTLSAKVDMHSMNPVFSQFYRKPPSKIDKMQIIAAYKVNAFNLNLFHRLPIKIYRKREDYYILSKVMRAYVMKSCRSCSKTLVNYEIVGNIVNPVTTSFLFEMSPNYTFREVRLLAAETRTYRATLAISNYTGYQYAVELRCKKGCRFSGQSEVLKHSFEFNKNFLAITSFKTDRNSFAHESALLVELEFEVDPGAESLVLELQQTKTMTLKSTITITDDILVDFGTPARFFDLFQ